MRIIGGERATARAKWTHRARATHLRETKFMYANNNKNRHPHTHTHTDAHTNAPGCARLGVVRASRAPSKHAQHTTQLACSEADCRTAKPNKMMYNVSCIAREI